MKPICLLSALFALGAAQGAYGAPAPLSNTSHNLEGVWAFRIDPSDSGAHDRWFAPDIDDSSWRRLTVPGYWEPQGVTDPRPGQAPKPKNGMPWTDYDGVAWYRLHFTIPPEWASKPLLLRLGHPDDEDRVYVNGAVIGETGPASPGARRYAVPVGAVYAGKDNVLAVRVTDGGGPGGLMGTAISLLPTDAESLAPLPQSDRPLADRIQHPPADARILKIIHGPPDSPADEDDLLDQLREDGFGGVVTNVSFDQYLESEAKWASFARTIAQAKKRGMSLWLYDEKGYPSGAAGGLTLRNHPDWEARGLYFAVTDSDGGAVAMDLPPGSLKRVAAYRRNGAALDLQSSVDLTAHAKDGKLMWDAPSGPLRVIAISEDRLYDGTHASVSLGDKLPYVNLLMAEPTAKFLELTHAEYAKRVDGNLGKWFEATFTDEPSLMSLFMRTRPWRVLPTSPGLAAEFAKRRGYPLDSILPALVTDVGPATKSARYDFWLTIAELVSQNYFGQIRDWCRAHQIASGGHLLLEESLLMHVPLYGDYFRCARQLDAPSIDCLTSIPEDVPWFVARQIGSVADLEGRAVTMCETSDHVQRYRPSGDARPARIVSEDEIRGTVNRLMVNGVNTITSYYSFADLKPEQLVRLNEWTGRCCTALRGGRQVTDIAVLYPIESAWTRFVPARHMVDDCPADARRIEQSYRAAGDDLYNSGRDFTYVDSKALSDARAESGALTLNALRWRAVILPETDTLPLVAWRNLLAFWRSGGMVIALGARPANSEREFPAPEVKAIADEIFGTDTGASCVRNSPDGGVGVFLAHGSVPLLPAVLDAALGREVTVGGATSPVRSTHRLIEGKHLYFLINDSASRWRGAVKLSANGAGEHWDPATGKQTPIDASHELSLDLGPYGAALYRTDTALASARHTLSSDFLRKMRQTALPEVAPSISKGEFVRGELTSRPVLAGAPAWKASAVLTKGAVDTFLFTVFDYPKQVDLSHASLLKLTVETPNPPQKAHVTLLVIVRDAKGAEYMAETEHTMSATGLQSSYFRLNQLRRASWSKDAAGALDLSTISGIRIGWGGYLGTENEAVEFSLAAPTAVTIGE